MGAASIGPGDPYWRNVQVCEDGEAAATKNWAVPAMTVTLHGTPAPSTTTPQAQRASTDYNGTTDWTEIGTQADWEQGGTYTLVQPFTIDLKFRARTMAGNMALVSNRQNLAKDFAGPQGGIEVVLIPDGRIYIGSYYSSSGVDFAIAPVGTIVVGTNYDVRAVLAGNVYYMMINGGGGGKIYTAPLTGYHAGNLSMAIGARHTAAQPVDQFFDGRIECRITNNVDRGHVAYTPELAWIAG